MWPRSLVGLLCSVLLTSSFAAIVGPFQADKDAGLGCLGRGYEFVDDEAVCQTLYDTALPTFVTDDAGGSGIVYDGEEARDGNPPGCQIMWATSFGGAMFFNYHSDPYVQPADYPDTTGLDAGFQVVYWCNDDSPCLLYTSPSPRDKRQSRMPSSA